MLPADDTHFSECEKWLTNMLTRLTIRNFKLFEEAVIELGENVVFIGPNNSGKTTALQGLALWSVGCRLSSVA